jgi:aryl-alcohol dehydrogenase-like predicted oxidoreductase
MLAAVHEAGIGVIVKEPLANGRLTGRGAIPELAAAAERVGTTPDALALAVALSQPWADVVLSGAATPTALRSNLAALTLEPPRELLDELDGLREEPAHYWRARAELPWN